MYRPGLARKSRRLTLEQLEDRLLLSSNPAPTNVVVPNDPQFSSQYALQNTGQNGGTPGVDINATGAWDVTTGTPSMTVAVLDTGVDYDHPDLYDNIWINQAEIPRIPFTTAFDEEYGLPLGSSRYSILQDVYHDGSITFADLNNPINQGPGKITDLDGAPYIDATDILTPMVTTTATQPGQNAPLYDTGLGGWAYPGNTQDGDTLHPNDFIGWNFVDNNNNPMDENGHGTNVTGVIGAMGNNNTGVAGVAWNTSIMVLQIEDASGNGTLANLIDAIHYATEHGANILNNSWGGVGNSPNLLTAIQQTQEAGEIFVIAAGNGGVNIDTTPTYPMSWNVSNVVSVAAVDDNGNLASFSNYGANSVDLAAPGVNILSTYPGKSYNSTTGTSMATPFVTGVMDLVWSEHPTWTAEQVIDDVMDTVTKLPSLQGKVISGGMVNAAAAVGWTPTYPPPPASPPPVSPSPASAPDVAPSIIGDTLIGAANTISELQVTFSKPIMAGSFTPSTLFFYNPSGQQIAATSVTLVAGSNDTEFDILFPTQTADGGYSLKIGPEVFDNAWTKMTVFQTTLWIGPVPPPPPPPPPLVAPSIVSDTLVGAPNTISELQVTFNEPIMASSFTPSTLFFYNPSSQQIAATSVTLVSGSNDTEFDILFPTQTADGSYSLKIGPEVFNNNWTKMTVFQTTLWLGPVPPPPPPPPPDVAPSIVSDTLLGTPNTISEVQVTFSKPIMAGSFTPTTLFFYNPSGQQIAAQSVTLVASSNDTEFDILFPTQTAVGTYSLKIGPEVFDNDWTKMTVFQTTFTIDASYSFSAPTQLVIPANASASSAVRVNQNLTVQSVTVNVNITFPKDGNLVLILEAPDGTEVKLANLNGGSGQNFQNTTFDDNAATSISAGSAPFNGTYQPASSLAGLTGKNASGIWTLLVENTATGSTGTLNNWSMTILGQ
jgi:subtilisin family serine protease/subtilisin-like proprotein convertase family protein